MERFLGGVALAAVAGGCLYIEGGGGVYGGNKGAGAGWSVAGGVYLDLDVAKLSTGGGGSVVHAAGDRHLGAGIHNKLDVTVKKDGGSGGATYLRATAAFSFASSDDEMPDDDSHDGWALFVGATGGLSVRDDGEYTFSEVLNLYASFGIDTVHADDATMIGPSVRVGAGTNLAKLLPVIPL
jgi:hypothetical protein